MAEAASAPPAGIDWAPPRWGGVAARWGRPPGPAQPDEQAVIAQQQALRIAAQQQQAMAELAWRAQAAAAAFRPPVDPDRSSP